LQVFKIENLMTLITFKMEKTPKILVIILIVLILFARLDSVVYCQDSKQDTIPPKIIELPKGCKLVLDANIDPTGSLSLEIIKKIKNIVPRIQSLIPLDSVTINLAISSSNVLPSFGVGSRTVSDDNGIRVEFYFDPKNPNFNIELIPNGLVHECHHASRLSMPNWHVTLLELIIMEGLADHFMVEVTKCEQPQWSKALSEDQIKQYLKKVKPILFEKHESWDEEFNEKVFIPWMFGRSGDTPIPAWTGYTLGWRIVENYIKELASSLVFTSAEEIASSTPELQVDK
jgi:hypothetical protein